MKSIEERLKKAALGAGCLFLALGAFEMQSHAADAASQVQSRALLVTRGDYEGTEYDLTPGPQNDGGAQNGTDCEAEGGRIIAASFWRFCIMFPCTFPKVPGTSAGFLRFLSQSGHGHFQ